MLQYISKKDESTCNPHDGTRITSTDALLTATLSLPSHENVILHSPEQGD